ncbi:C-X-C motif chemokine 19 [Pundamilia nyererei]|uniref:Interleukin-8-like n=2 Tax=Haplochromini TaxID=319058 RepID=A0A3B4H4S3_9CICH|nr:PREDICTED: interleukin-8-like [Pundamilia nyererei]XP_026018109.1 interleukin-8-like isoform X2 [Astatotilapia calliptera]
MKLCVLIVFGTLLVLSHGMPPISRDYNTHCRCLQVESRIIPPDTLRSIKLFPEGPHCPDTEVIAGLANGAKVCLNPHSAWVKKLINFFLEKQQTGMTSKKRA